MPPWPSACASSPAQICPSRSGRGSSKSCRSCRRAPRARCSGSSCTSGCGRGKTPPDRALEPRHQAREPVRGFFQVLQRSCEREAKVSRSTRTEARSIEQRDRFLLQQPIRERGRAERKRAHVGKGVEGAGRLVTANARDPRQARDDRVAPRAELGHHRIHYVLRPAERGNPGFGDHRSGGIGGRVEYDHPGPRGDRPLEHVEIEREPLIEARRHRDRRRAAEAHHRRVDGESRIGHQHFVTGRESREKTVEEVRLGSRRDQDMLGIRPDAPLREVLRDRLAQHRRARRRAVARVPVAERAHAGLDDVRRRGKVRLADLEMDDLAPARFDGPRLHQHVERSLRPEQSHPAGDARHAGSLPRVGYCARAMEQHGNVFLTNLAIVLCVAAVTTVVFQRLRQPVVLGYILAGLLVGPHVPFPLVADDETIRGLSELGVILLLFTIGLEFTIEKLLRVGAAAAIVAAVEVSIQIILGDLAGRIFGWSARESLFAGAVVAISSTTIIAKAFAELRIGGRLRELVLSILIVEDLIAILLLAALTTLSAGGLSAARLGITAGRLALFLACVAAAGLLIIPRLVRAILKLDRPETTAVASVGICFAFALLAQRFGYSVALGAFLAGTLVAESQHGAAIEHLLQPVRDLFAAVFFVSVGMLIDPGLVRQHWAAILVLSAVVIAGKTAGVSIPAFLTGAGVRTSVAASMSLAQIGEFSFIIAGVGTSTGIVPDFFYPVAVSVSALTTLRSEERRVGKE